MPQKAQNNLYSSSYTMTNVHFILIKINILVIVSSVCSQSTGIGLPWPIQGQGAPPDGRTQVTVDIHIDRILEVDPKANTWRAIHWLVVEWRDQRALQALQVRQDQSGLGSAWLCQFPLFASNEGLLTGVHLALRRMRCIMIKSYVFQVDRL